MRNCPIPRGASWPVANSAESRLSRPRRCARWVTGARWPWTVACRPGARRAIPSARDSSPEGLAAGEIADVRLGGGTVVVVERLDVDSLEGAAVQGAQIDAVAVGIGARHIEGL